MGHLYLNAGITDFRAGSVAYKLAAALTLAIARSSQDMMELIQSSGLLNAVGTDLQDIAQRFFAGQTELYLPKEGQNAYGGAVIFNRGDPPVGVYTIQAGTKVVSVDGLKYKTQENAVIEDGEYTSSVPVNVVAEKEGSQYNLSPHYLAKVEGLNDITPDNLTAITDGTESEDDGRYRQRLLDTYHLQRLPLNKRSVQDLAKQVGIDNVAIARLWGALTLILYWDGLENLKLIEKTVTLLEVKPGDTVENPVFKLPNYPLVSAVVYVYFTETPEKPLDSELNTNNYIDPLRGELFCKDSFSVAADSNTKTIVCKYFYYPDSRFQAFVDKLLPYVAMDGQIIFVAPAPVLRITSAEIMVITHSPQNIQLISTIKQVVANAINATRLGESFTQTDVCHTLEGIDNKLTLSSVTFTSDLGSASGIYPSYHTKLKIELGNISVVLI